MQGDTFSFKDLHSDIVGFNVGGFVFQTKKATLSKKALNNKPTYFEKILKGEISIEKDRDGNFFIDRDGDCMKVILSYLRTDELDIPPNIRSYDLDKESLFYNIELPKANARNRHRRKIELRKNGIYTSDASFFYFKILNSHTVLHGQDWKYGSNHAKPVSYEIRGNDLLFPEMPLFNRLIINDGNNLISYTEAWGVLSFVESKPIAKEISTKFPFGVQEGGKKKHQHNVRIHGTHIEVTDSSGHVVVQADAEPNPQDFYVAQLKFHGTNYIVELYGHFVQIINIAKDKTKRVPTANIFGQVQKEKKNKQNDED